MSEQTEFLKDIEQSPESILDRNIETEAAPEKEKVEDDTEKEERFKNRAYRRLEQKYEKEREASIALAERVKVLSEVGKFREEVGDDSLKEVEAIFGTDTPEKLAATNLLKGALSRMSDKAKEAAIEALESRYANEGKEQKEADEEVDSILERVEDYYKLDMSDENVRKGFITLMEKMSPKYEDGNIKEFADPDAVAETYLALQKREGSSRARELASRSMTRSGESQPSKLQQTAEERFLQENGLIF